ncbi:MAG: oxidoreductase [Rhodobacteraceae bacterium]|nr:oxidoreductase [Paracoccaceae bacterium]MBR27532.1 oxidoreductase [Paracoccaceae bacterium]
MSGRFEGRSAVVTGAGSGIGRATALLLAEEGAKVLAVDLGEAVHGTAALHPAIEPLLADAGDEGAVAEMVAHACARQGGLDVMVANAGISGGFAGLFEQSAEDWASLLRVNLIGPFLAIKHGGRAMIDADRAGAIVCTASVAGLRAGAGGPAYSASKAGVINLVQVAAQQFAWTGIRVNAVCPGLIETGMTRVIYDAARAKGREGGIGQLTPLKRGGEPGEIAEAIAWLASDAASYVNGQALAVDGGLSSSHPVARQARPGETSA